MFVDELVLSRLVYIYRHYLEKWGLKINASNSTIFAIARKGPRLVELLVRESILHPSVLDRTLSEHSIPFYEFKNGEEVILIDDSVQHGSTFTRVKHLLEHKAKETGVSIKIISLPFAVSMEMREELRGLCKFDTVGLQLPKEQINSFIDCEISSFKLLGKPYDIEHPILSLKGNFSDGEVLEATLSSLINELSTNLKCRIDIIPVTSKVTVAKDVYESKSWTILIKSDNDRKIHGPEFNKLRIFLNSEKQMLSIVPIVPTALSNKMVDDFKKILPSQMEETWESVNRQLEHPYKFSELEYERKRSKVVFANYLISFAYLKRIFKLIHTCFDYYYPHVLVMGISPRDLQFLVGSKLSFDIADNLNCLLTSDEQLMFKSKINNEALYPQIKEAGLPEEYKKGYDAFLSEITEVCTNVFDILSYIFYAQHLKIEIPQRAEKVDINVIGKERLRFGVTLKYIIGIVESRLPHATLIQIHAALDELIDSGCIVPKYMDVSKSESIQIWVRTFRIGEGSEGSTPKRMQALIHLCETLENVIGSESLPSVLLEKFSVLALTNDFPCEPLRETSPLKISKGYSLYGARSQMRNLSSSEYLLDNGTNLKVLTRNGDNFSLTKNCRETYPKSEIALSENTLWKIEDIGLFCGLLHRTPGLKSKALVTITTLASQDEYFLALSAELDLWLNHPISNIYNCINSLVSLIEEQKKMLDAKAKGANQAIVEGSYNAALKRVDSLFVENANFTAQVKEKKEWFARKDETYDLIDAAIRRERTVSEKRVWSEIYSSLKAKDANGKEISSGIEEILSALRVAHYTTSLLRNTLSHLGFPSSKAVQIDTAFQNWRNLIESGKNGDHYICSMSHDYFKKPAQGEFDIVGALSNLSQLSTLSNTEIVKSLRPVVQEVANRCARLLAIYGPVKEEDPVVQIPPPVYIMMWDVRNSSTGYSNDRQRLERDFIKPVVNKLKDLQLRDRIRDFKLSMDDGNGFICNDFNIVLNVFNLLKTEAINHGVKFRAGCDVNYQGELHYYTNSKTLGGKAYEFTQRITNFFKDGEGDWNGIKIEEPDQCYLVVSELAERIAKANGEWKNVSDFQITPLDGEFNPRSHNGMAFPFTVNVITPKSKS